MAKLASECIVVHDNSVYRLTLDLSSVSCGKSGSRVRGMSMYCLSYPLYMIIRERLLWKSISTQRE